MPTALGYGAADWASTQRFVPRVNGSGEENDIQGIEHGVTSGMMYLYVGSNSFWSESQLVSSRYTQQLLPTTGTCKDWE